MARQISDDLFVMQQLNALMPVWSSDAARARDSLELAIGARRKSRALVAAGATVFALVAVALAPVVRTFAQDVWARWTMTRVEVVAVAPGLFTERRMSAAGGGSFATQGDAERAAGFSLHLPPAATAGQPTTFVTMGPVLFEEAIDAEALNAALERVGASEVVVPHEWHGAVIRAHVRSGVAVQYPGDLMVVQSDGLPSLDVPAGIPLSDLAAVIFRASGMPEEAARRAGLDYESRPAWLVRVAPGELESVEHLSLRNGSAWLMTNVSTGFRDGLKVVVQSSGSRVFVVISPSREQAIAVTESLP